MHLLTFVDSPDHVCCRYRFEAFRAHLEQQGYSLELRSWPKSLLGRLRALRSARMADVVIVQRKLLPLWMVRWLRRAAPFLLFDFDDAIFLRDSYSPKGTFDAKRLRRFTAMAQSCNAVIGGNTYLARFAEQCSNAVQAYVIPTCVEPGLYPLACHSQELGKATLAWIGSSSTLQGLGQIRDILNGIGSHTPDVTLKVICDRSLELESIPVQFTPWSTETEGAELASADVGISWIPDDEWSRGKCGLKILQYMAAGLPVVTNPVGAHTEMIRHGDNGFLVETPEEWLRAIDCLRNDPGLRRRMGQAARKVVEERYSVRHGAELWLSLLNDIQSTIRKSA